MQTSPCVHTVGFSHRRSGSHPLPGLETGIAAESQSLGLLRSVPLLQLWSLPFLSQPGL